MHLKAPHQIRGTPCPANTIVSQNNDGCSTLGALPGMQSMDPEYLLQNALALTLITLLLLSTGNVLIKLVFVGYTLVAAAFRYVAVGVLLLVLLVVFS